MDNIFDYLPTELKAQNRPSSNQSSSFCELKRLSKHFELTWDKSSWLSAAETKSLQSSQNLTSRKEWAFQPLHLSLFLFVHRLFTRVTSDGVKDLFFLSREGQLLKYLFDSYQTGLGVQLIKTHYLMVSRKSTYLATIDLNEKSPFKILFRQYSKTSGIEFLKTIGFTENEILNLNIPESFNLKIRSDNFENGDLYKRLLSSDSFKVTLDRKIQHQKFLIKNYINQFKTSANLDELAVVDVGWKGSIQDNIFLALDRGLPIRGYYLGLTEWQYISSLSKKIPILYSCPQQSRDAIVFNENRPLFEIILAANHGGVTGYNLNSDGLVVPTTEWIPLEQQFYNNSIAPIQDIIKKDFLEIQNSYFAGKITSKKLYKKTIKEHSKMVWKPSSMQIDEFQKWTHFENFGVFEFANYKQQKNVFSKSYGRDLIQLVKNPRHAIYRDIWPALTFRNYRLEFLKNVHFLIRTIQYHQQHSRLLFYTQVMLTYCKSLMGIVRAILSQQRILTARVRYFVKLKIKKLRV